jgi:uncharacterized protein (TIGR03086 family)
MTFIDLEPAAQRMTDLIRAIPDDLLDTPTPCAAYALGDLLDHVSALTVGLTAAATKATHPGGSQPRAGDASRLGGDWRTRIPQELAALTEAWRDPMARRGMIKAGGIEMPGEAAALVALEELVIHGWDVARATGQHYACDETALEAVVGFFSLFTQEMRENAYSAPLAVPDEVPLLDTVVALSGRDPSWKPS